MEVTGRRHARLHYVWGSVFFAHWLGGWVSLRFGSDAVEK